MENQNKILQNKIENQVLQLKNNKSQILTITNSKINSDNTIIVNNIGSENIDYITDKVFQSFIKLPLGGISKYVKQIHFHPKHPENHNIKITNKKMKYAEVKENNKWILKDKKDVLNDLIDNGFIALEEYKTWNEDKLNQLISVEKNQSFFSSTNRVSVEIKNSKSF